MLLLPTAPQQARNALLTVAGLGAAAVAAALYSQHQLQMLPCPWCILQRIIFLLIAALALLAALAGPGRLRRAAAAVGWLLAGCGMAAALWQHFVAASSASCNLTLADRIISGLGLDSLWPEVFGVFASCAEAKVSMLGLPYEFYSLVLFIVLAVPLWMVIKQPTRALP